MHAGRGFFKSKPKAKPLDVFKIGPVSLISHHINWLITSLTMLAKAEMKYFLLNCSKGSKKDLQLECHTHILSQAVVIITQRCPNNFSFDFF